MKSANDIGQKERRTQQRIVKLFRDLRGYEYDPGLADSKDADENPAEPRAHQEAGCGASSMWSCMN